MTELEKHGFVVLPALLDLSPPEFGTERRSLVFKTKILVDAAPPPEVVELATAYYGKPVTEWDAEFITTRPTDRPEEGSQLWHRDAHAGWTCIRSITYLTDVGIEDGPLEYAQGTHPRGEFSKVPDGRFKGCPVPNWTTITGPKGTTVVFDILGFHRGLKNVRGERKALSFTLR